MLLDRRELTMMRLLDRVFLLRLTLFYPIWTFFLAGYWGGQASGFQGEGGRILILMTTLTGLSLIMGCVFILNQIQDVETDRANGKLFLLANACISVSEATWQALIMAFLGLVAGLWMGIRVAAGFTGLLILSGWLYNFPPAGWKDHPLMGILTNAAGGSIIYWLGWITAGGTTVHLLRIAAYTLAGGAVFLNTTLPDIDGDQKTGKVTFGVRYGLTVTVRWACILECIAVILAVLARDWLLFIPGFFVLPLFVWSALKRTLEDSIRATKFSVLALAGAVCVVFPLFLIPVVLVFFVSKWYYRKRFDFDYPSFKTS